MAREPNPSRADGHSAAARRFESGVEDPKACNVEPATLAELAAFLGVDEASAALLAETLSIGGSGHFVLPPPPKPAPKQTTSRNSDTGGSNVQIHDQD